MAYHSYPSKFVVWYKMSKGIKQMDIVIRRLNALSMDELGAALAAYRASI